MRLSVISLVLGLACAAGSANAARLAPEECDGLKSEQRKLVDDGTRDDMQHGPEWAKAKLPAAKLARIKRLIEVEEQIAFRCDRPRVAHMPAATATTAPEAAHPATAGQPAHAAPAVAEEAPAEPVRKGKKGRKAKAQAPAEGVANPAATAETKGAVPEAGAAAAPEPPAEEPPARPKKGKKAKPSAAAQVPAESAAVSTDAKLRPAPRQQ